MVGASAGVAADAANGDRRRWSVGDIASAVARASRVVNRPTGQLESLHTRTLGVHGTERPVEANLFPFELRANPTRQFRDRGRSIARQQRCRLNFMLLIGRTRG